MKNHEMLYPVTKMSKALNVNKSGYYAWKKRKTSRRAEEQRELVPVIQVIQKNNHWEYGEKRITHELRRQGWFVSRNRIIRILSEECLGVRHKKRFVLTTDSKHNKAFAPNLLNRQFIVNRLNVAWVTDITYCRYRNEFLYLCVFIDLYSRRVVGWSLGKTMEASLVTAAFSMALSRRKPPQGLMVHSDRGSQYCSDEFIEMIDKNNCVQSMSRKGNCWDNAVAESFFRTLKRELLGKRVYTTVKEMHIDLFEYLEGYYDRVRLHSTLNYKTPLEFEELGA